MGACFRDNNRMTAVLVKSDVKPQRDPKKADALYNKGLEYYESSDFEKAIKYFKKSIEYDE